MLAVVAPDVDLRTSDPAKHRRHIMETKMFRTLVRVALVMTFTATTGIFLTACNTVEGLGKDIEAGGKATSGAARDVKKKL